MAQTNRKQTASSAKKGTSGSGKKNAKQSVTPIRREVGGAVCFFLAVLLIISYFNADAALLRFLRTLCEGFIGTGYYLAAPMLLLASFALVFHRGRPVTARVLCTLLTPVAFGAFCHVVACDETFAWKWKILVDLFRAGSESNAGGCISGLMAVAVSDLISGVGAGILFAVATLLLLLRGFNMTLPSIIRAVEERPRPSYTLDEEHPAPDPAKKIVDHVAQRQIDRQEYKRISSYNLPIDDPVEVPKPSRKKSNQLPMSPAEYLQSQRAQQNPEPVTEAAPEADVPVVQDIAPEPFVPEPAAEPTKPERMSKRVRPQRRTEKIEPPEEPAAESQAADVSVPEHGSSMIDEVDAFLSDMQTTHTPEEIAEAKQAVSAMDKVSSQDAKQAAIDVTLEINGSELPQEAYRFPQTSLLISESSQSVDGTDEMRANVDRLNATLHSFSIDAHITNVIRGPSVTRYEVELDAGVKLSKLTNLADDIALALGATGVRIAAIPNKISVVGIEVPNKTVSTVHIREVLESPAFQNHKSNICFSVGKDIGGNYIVGDIARLPHMLIAGTTGSGKSVCTNSLIISLLYKSTPEDVRLIMVDPKMVELGVYNGIPHLLIPVVTDPKKAAGALQWAVTEMMRRYNIMAEASVREIDVYNKKIAADDPKLKLPRIVILIDELADLMLVAAKEVEESICRVAQMGRAAGMHLVIATQRPSADVITGLMKANIPSRIAFAVASSLESRIILDTPGAEKLVGRGDMLFAPLGTGKPQRVQGCFITDGEIQAVIDYIKDGTEAAYSTEVMDQINQQADKKGSAPAAAEPPETTHDEMLPAAVEVILETKQASVSMLQRRLKLGYARAARIVDEMEDMGIVGPFEGSKPRQLLITKEQWAEMQGAASVAPNEPVEDEIPPWDDGTDD